MFTFRHSRDVSAAGFDQNTFSSKHLRTIRTILLVIFTYLRASAAQDVILSTRKHAESVSI